MAAESAAAAAAAAAAATESGNWEQQHLVGNGGLAPRRP